MPARIFFSFGTLLYEMATGRRAFNQASPVAALSALLREKPPPLPQSSSQPAALGELIARCLEKEPARRYASAAEVRAALQAHSARGSNFFTSRSMRGGRSSARTDDGRLAPGSA